MEKVNSTDISFDSGLNILRFKIVFVGDVSVGKTSIITQIMDNKFKDDYEPSIGVDFFSKTLRFRDKCIKLQVWDSAGQEKYRSLIPNYIRGSSIVFLIFDITKTETFNSIDSWIQFVKDNEQTTCVLVGNKNDLRTERKVNEDDIANKTKQHGLSYFEVSAKTGEGIRKMLFSSVASLPFFDHSEIDKVIQDLETENNNDTILNTNRSSLSILEQSKGGLRLYRDEQNEVIEDNEVKDDDDKKKQQEKKKCSC